MPSTSMADFQCMYEAILNRGIEAVGRRYFMYTYVTRIYILYWK